MHITSTLPRTKESGSPTARSLQDVLTDTYNLYLATHNCHWNVEGPKFLSLHALFENQYNALFIAIDLVAERIRALGCYVLPFESRSDARGSGMHVMPAENGTQADALAARMVEHLITLNGFTVKSCQAAKKQARDASDDESENMMVERITAHQKMIWMLQSTIK